MKFVPEQIEHELSQVRTQLDQLSKENEEQQREIATLRENLRSSEQSKEQLVEEREKTNELQNIINQGAIGLFIFNIFFNFLSPFLLGKTKFDEFESSYQELQQKYHVLEEIKSEYDSLKEQLAAEREKTNELQNIINRETIGLSL